MFFVHCLNYVWFLLMEQPFNKQKELHVMLLHGLDALARTCCHGCSLETKLNERLVLQHIVVRT